MHIARTPTATEVNMNNKKISADKMETKNERIRNHKENTQLPRCCCFFR